MSLRCAGSQLLQTVPSTLLAGASTVSLSIWVRVNSGSDFTNSNGVQLFGDGGGKLAVGLSAAGRLQASWSANDGGADHASSWSQSLIPGVNYHLAATWQDGAQRYYVNGLLVGSDAQHGVLGKLGDSATHPFRLGSDVAGVDVTLDEPTLWVGYALTAADVGTLRDRVAAPSTISPASIALRWTLAGPDGATAAPGDAGLVDGSTSRLDLTSVIGGAPSYQSGVLTYSLLDRGCTAMVAPSGQGILFKFHDAATNPSNVTNVVDNNEQQSIVISGQPAGGAFTLTFGGHTTAPIPAIPSPPYRYFQWNKTLPGPGHVRPRRQPLHRGQRHPEPVLRGLRRDDPARHRHAEQRLLHQLPAGAFGGPPNPTPFADNTSPTPLTTHDGRTLYWYPLGAAGVSHPGRYTFASTALHVRVSCDMEDPNGPNAGRDGLAIDNLRIATTDGATVLRLDASYPPGTLVAPGSSLGTDPTGWQVSDDTHVAVEIAGLGAGVRYLLDPSAVRSALEALPDVGVGNVTATGDGSAMTPVLVTMVGSLGGVTQPLMTASDAAVRVAEVARGGLLPSIRVNGGSPIPLPYSWMHYYAGTSSMPGVYFGFPQAPPPVTYSGARHGDNTVQGGPWQVGPDNYAGYTANAMVVTGSGTATYYYRPATPGDYRVSFSWAPDASYSADVVYSVATTPYALVTPVASDGTPRTIGGVLVAPVGNPCTVTATADGPSILAVSVTVVGLDASGHPATETLPAFTAAPPSGQSSVSGSTVFSRIFSVVMPPHGDRNSSTSLSANPVVLGTYHANQTAAPPGAIDQGVHWLIGGTFTLTGLNNGLVVTQSFGAPGTMIADTVRFERLSSDTSMRVSSSDVVTYSAGDAWASCQAGTAPAASNAAVQNLAGRALYPPLPGSVSMGIGYNLPGMGTNAATFVFNNLLTAVYGIQDWPTTIGNAAEVFYLSLPGQTFGGDNRSYPNMPTGHHVLTWDGASDLRITTQGGVVAEYATTTYPAPGGVGNQRFYDFRGDAFFYGPVCFLTLHGTTLTGSGSQYNAKVSNATLLPEGLSPDTAPKFRQNVIDRFAGMQSIRCMDSTSAITGNPTEFADIQPPASYVTRGRRSAPSRSARTPSGSTPGRRTTWTRSGARCSCSRPPRPTACPITSSSASRGRASSTSPTTSATPRPSTSTGDRCRPTSWTRRRSSPTPACSPSWAATGSGTPTRWSAPSPTRPPRSRCPPAAATRSGIRWTSATPPIARCTGTWRSRPTTTA